MEKTCNRQNIRLFFSDQILYKFESEAHSLLISFIYQNMEFQSHIRIIDYNSFVHHSRAVSHKITKVRRYVLLRIPGTTFTTSDKRYKIKQQVWPRVV